MRLTNNATTKMNHIGFKRNIFQLCDLCMGEKGHAGKKGMHVYHRHLYLFYTSPCCAALT